jgi:hypothetical protein
MDVTERTSETPVSDYVRARVIFQLDSYDLDHSLSNIACPKFHAKEMAYFELIGISGRSTKVMADVHL